MASVEAGVMPSCMMSAVRKAPGQRVLHGRIDEVRVVRGVEGIAQHHREAEQGGERIGQVLAGNVRRGAVHRLVERLALAVLVL